MLKKKLERRAPFAWNDAFFRNAAFEIAKSLPVPEFSGA